MSLLWQLWTDARALALACPARCLHPHERGLSIRPTDGRRPSHRLVSLAAEVEHVAVSPPVLPLVENLLSLRFGTDVRIAAVQDFPYAQVSRCTLHAASSAVPPTVIVRVPRHNPARTGLARLRNEQAALTFLGSIGSTLAPRFIAGDTTAGILVTEDLGPDPSLLNLLLGSDMVAARQGLVAFAQGLGTLHAQTAGRASAYHACRAQLGPSDPSAEDAAVRFHIAESWQRVQDAVAHLHLPPPHDVDRDIAEVVRTFAAPGPFLALSNGDPSPLNCMIAHGVARFFDFEGATFRHALVDAAVLRYLYPTGGPPWHLPDGMVDQIEQTYREAIAPGCPEIYDDAAYESGMAAASAAWTILRMERLPRVEAGPDRDSWPLLPSGWSAPIPTRSRRHQLVSVIDTFIASARRAGTLELFADWCESLVVALRARWPEATEDLPLLYPAFQ